MNVVGIVHNGLDAVDLIDGLEPDVVLWDDAMPDMDGIGALGLIQETHPALPLMVMAGGGKPIRAVDALAAGAFSIIDKRRMDLKLLPDMIRILAQGRGAIVEADMLRKSIGDGSALHDHRRRKLEFGAVAQDSPEELSLREFGILQLVVRDYTDEEISSELSLDVTAVRADLESICRKLQVKDVSSLGLVAARLGLVDNR